MVVSIDPRLSEIQFVRAIRLNFPAVNAEQISELKNNTHFFIPQKDLTSKECLMLSLKINEAFQMPTKNFRNVNPKPETKPKLFTVNVYYMISEDEAKEEVLNKNATNVTKVSRITSRAGDKAPKLLRVTTESNNQVNNLKLCIVSRVKKLATQRGKAIRCLRCS